MTTATLDLDGNKLVLDCGARDTDRAKQVPGMNYHPKRLRWEARASLPVALAARGTFGADLVVTPAVQEWVRPARLKAMLIEAIKATDPQALKRPAHDGLQPHQITGAEIMSRQHGFILGDERGNGKTVTVTGTIHDIFRSNLEWAPDHPLPALVVATKSMLYTWKSEAEKWIPGAHAYVVDGTKTKQVKTLNEARCSADDGVPTVVIITWSLLRAHTHLAPYGSIARTDAEKVDRLLNGGWIRTVICDEAHRMKDPKAKQTRAAWAVGDTATYRYALTATPRANSSADVWSLLRFCDPDGFPSRQPFVDRYFLLTRNIWGGVDDLGLNPLTEQEFRTVFNAYYIRRPLVLDVSALPPQVRLHDMEPKQAKAYKAMKEKMIAEVDGGILVAGSVLVRDTRLHQIAAATPVLDEEGNVVELTMPSSKVSTLIDVLDEMGGEPLVVFAESRKLVELCYKELTKGNSPIVPVERVGMIHGNITGQDREDTKEAFQAGKLDVILLTLKAGSEGLTLTRANTILFLQRSYEAIANRQAEGRVLRIGQTRNVQIIDAVTRGTIEEALHEAAQDKEELLAQLVEDEEFIRRSLHG